MEEVWNKLEYNKELQKIIQWRIGNQRLDERMMIAFQDRQERIQRRDEAKQRWRARNALRMEPMELDGGQGDWWDTEFHEHEAINSMMVNLGIYDDMEIGEDHESIIDESFGLEVDEALEHAFLDRMLEGIDDLKMEVSDDDGDSASEDYGEGEGVHDGLGDTAVPGDIDIDIAEQEEPNGHLERAFDTAMVKVNENAYMMGGTWWINGWKSSTKNTHKDQPMRLRCRNKLGCACNSDNKSLTTTRLLKPVSVDCSSDRVSFKRSRKEPIVWQKRDKGKRGSLPRIILTANRRRQEPTSRSDEVVLESTPEGSKRMFGGSGAKFAPLRNQRGVQSGSDGRVQGKILLTVSSEGKGRFSLSLSGGDGGQTGKRPAENNLSPGAKKRKVINPK